MELQKSAFLNYEWNSWFDRNRRALLNYKIEDDKIISLLKSYKQNTDNILEIGCRAGYKLNDFKNVFPHANVFGIELPINAIEFGKPKYSSVNFKHRTADDMKCYEDAQFDVVIVEFVFYVIDRSILFKSVAEINRVVRNRVYLIIKDFFSQTALKKNYHQIENFSAYTFKQNYEEIFRALELYHLMGKSSFDHGSLGHDSNASFQNQFSITLLKKDLDASYK